jgi:hypothetical protein
VEQIAGEERAGGVEHQPAVAHFDARQEAVVPDRAMGHRNPDLGQKIEDPDRVGVVVRHGAKLAACGPNEKGGPSPDRPIRWQLPESA